MQQCGVQILAPTLVREALSAWVAGVTALRVAEPNADVTVAAGPGWAERLAVAGRTCSTGSTRSVVLITSGDQEELLRAGALGIRVFIALDDNRDTFVQAVQAAAQRRPFCSSSLMAALVLALSRANADAPATATPGPDSTPALSHRELEVALLAARGLSNKQIGTQMHVSVATVKFHLTNVYRKLSILGRAQLRRYLLQCEPIVL